MAIEINTEEIQSELQKLAGETKVKVKLNRHQEVATSIRETDKAIEFRLNPKRFRSPQKLEEHLDFCRLTAGRY